MERAASWLSRLVQAGVRSGLPVPIPRPYRRLHQQAQLRTLLRKLAVNCVVDVGANRGWYGRVLRGIGYAGRMVAFEPIPETFAELRRAAQGDPEWRCVNLALGARSASRPFHVIRNRQGGTVLSSFLQPKRLPIESDVTVEVRRLDEVLPDLLDGIENPRIFLKMDTQGFDLEVLAGADGILARVVGLQSEVSVTPIYEGMPHYTRALGHYESLGFSLLDLHIVNRNRQGGVLEYDCLMVRT